MSYAQTPNFNIYANQTYADLSYFMHTPYLKKVMLI